jgi:hypothetical protein
MTFFASAKKWLQRCNRTAYLPALTGASIVPAAECCKCQYRPFATMVAIYRIASQKGKATFVRRLLRLTGRSTAIR